jgi:hypothetical protein
MSERSLPEKPSADAPASPSKSKGPSKDKRAPRPQHIRGKLRLKAKAAKATRSDIAAAERQPDQTGLKRIAPSGEGYVRLRLRVEEDGGTSIVDSHFVESTLIQPSAIHGNFVYEITEGEKRLHLDSIPDLGVMRSFASRSCRVTWRLEDKYLPGPSSRHRGLIRSTRFTRSKPLSQS